jgi:hypothetical protein
MKERVMRAAMRLRLWRPFAQSGMGSLGARVSRFAQLTCARNEPMIAIMAYRLSKCLTGPPRPHNYKAANSSRTQTFVLGFKG